jgi:hypothetical protein
MVSFADFRTELRGARTLEAGGRARAEGMWGGLSGCGAQNALHEYDGLEREIL